MALSPVSPHDPAGLELPAGLGPAVLLDAVHAVVVVLDSQGRILHLNRWGEQMLGHFAREIRGLRPEELAPLASGGLYISREIIERHGGTLDARHTPGLPGITFFFELPRAR